MTPHRYPLSESKDARRETRVIDRAARDALGHAAKQRERPECDDERRDAQSRDQASVEDAAGATSQQRRRRRAGNRETPVMIGGAEHHRSETHHRADRQIDPAGDDDRRHRDGQDADLDAYTRDLEEVRQRQEARRHDREQDDFEDERAQQRPPRHD